LLLEADDDTLERMTMGLDYTFRFEAGGEPIAVNMQAFDGLLWPADYEEHSKGVEGDFGTKWPPHRKLPSLKSPAWTRPENTDDTPDLEAPAITRANLDQYLKDYVYWLTVKSVAPQLEAFRKGFLTCLHPKALKVLNPDTLQHLLEGRTFIDIAELKSVTGYEFPYHADHPTIRFFWDIVAAWDAERHRKLLAFLTGSDRVPASGLSSMDFTITHNQQGQDWLPVAHTCGGQLELPRYKNREIMKERLEMAIEHHEEFGLV
jgi:hypothetical protein